MLHKWASYIHAVPNSLVSDPLRLRILEMLSKVTGMACSKSVVSSLIP